MKINLDKLNEIYDKDNDLKELLDILLTKAFKDGDSGMSHIFYAFGFYEYDDDEIDDDDEILNIPLLLSLNKDLKNKILEPVKQMIKDDSETSDFFDEFIEVSGLFIPLSEYKKYERKLKLVEIKKNEKNILH